MMQRLFGLDTSTRRLPPRLAMQKQQNLANNIADNMAPNDVDVALITFNCAKQAIQPDVFGHHLCTAFEKNAAILPELVVL